MPSNGNAQLFGAKGPKQAPLLMFKDGRFGTRQTLVEALTEALQEAGIRHAKYSGHSLRKDAAANGLEESITKTLGR